MYDASHILTKTVESILSQLVPLVAEALKTANGVVAEVGTSSIVYQTFIGIF